MSDVQTLLTRCYELGAEFTPGPDGKLKVRAPAPLPEELREQLRQRKAEVLALLLSTPLPLRCRQCHAEARPAGGTLSQDQTNYIQFWHCLSCGAKGSTVFRLQ
jgi:hypothetical protein